MEKSQNNKRQKILIADDNEMNRAMLVNMLEDDYDIIEAKDGLEAVELLRQLGNRIALVLLDIVMPNMDGYEVLAVMNKKHWIDDIPVIMISAENRSSYIERAYELGVTDFISRPFDSLIVRRRVINTLMIYSKQNKLVDLVVDQINEKERNNTMMINILSHIVEFRNGESGLHVLHIHTMTELLLNHLSIMTNKYSLTLDKISMISLASALHDIGKISIDEKILNKPGKLTREEFEIMKTHTVVGCSMLENIPFYKDDRLIKTAAEICRWHHERYDGNGYPDHLKGEEIPLSAQIVSLADVYDALTSERVYKEAYSHEKALKMIFNGECGEFNPLLLQCLSDISDIIKDQLHVNSLSRSNRKEIINTVKKELKNNDLSSDDIHEMLDRERQKQYFFNEISNEIEFEYTAMPSILTLSKWSAKHLGLKEVTVNPLLKKSITEIIDKETISELSKQLKNTTPDNPVLRYDCKILVNGEKKWHRVISQAIWSGNPPVYIGSVGKVLDINDEYSKVADLQFKAAHDSLTGLLYSNYASKYIRNMIQKGSGKYALAIIDIDHFKDVNDKYGHEFGNRVLQFVAQCILDAIKSKDIASRVGGDEFLVFMEYEDDIEPLIERIYASMPQTYSGVPISVSMGIALSGQDKVHYKSLFNKADKALYAAKRNGRKQYKIYDSSMKDVFSFTPIDRKEKGKKEE